MLSIMRRLGYRCVRCGLLLEPAKSLAKQFQFSPEFFDFSFLPGDDIRQFLDHPFMLGNMHFEFFDTGFHDDSHVAGRRKIVETAMYSKCSQLGMAGGSC